MTTEITYAEVKFKNESKSSDPKLEVPDPLSKVPEAPLTEKTSPLNSNPLKSNSGIIKLLVATLLIFMLLTISFFTAFIVLSQELSKLQESSRKMNGELTRVYTCLLSYIVHFTVGDSVPCLLCPNFITQNLTPESHYYIGLTKTRILHQRRHWQWVDQTPYQESAAFWHKGEPSSHSEKCVVLKFHPDTKIWGWSDVQCHLPHRSICKM
ncbi:PREDICTED: C-type lectin domain family 4 member A-like [Condylura cristata]|uniref:C-type lectin domain family 4 member A-like n=1 Tax=Condylura cristata TaxID=143302 RepID=UPI00064341DA|nr:PREDICTED: C-type lectin domain family 4 member A-like [Condylura cristata]